jgi:hypothetical protein
MTNKKNATFDEVLATSIVSFSYKKANGEIRDAIGTRNLDLARRHSGADIPTLKGQSRPYSYFDLEKMAWRSFKPENLIKMKGSTRKADLSIDEFRDAITRFNNFLDGKPNEPVAKERIHETPKLPETLTKEEMDEYADLTIYI